MRAVRLPPPSNRFAPDPQPNDQIKATPANRRATLEATKQNIYSWTERTKLLVLLQLWDQVRWGSPTLQGKGISANYAINPSLKSGIWVPVKDVQPELR